MKKRYDILYNIFDFIKTASLCFVVIIIIFMMIFKPVQVIGESMFPTLSEGERGLSNAISVIFGDINRFDIVVVHGKLDDELWVKRVIGLPGEIIEGRNNKIYIDGKEIKQSFLENKKDDFYTDDFGPVKIPDDEYFLMGDHRRKSLDSRNKKIGTFHINEFVCKNLVVIYPFDKIRIVK